MSNGMGNTRTLPTVAPNPSGTLERLLEGQNLTEREAGELLQLLTQPELSPALHAPVGTSVFRSSTCRASLSRSTISGLICLTDTILLVFGSCSRNRTSPIPLDKTRDSASWNFASR